MILDTLASLRSKSTAYDDEGMPTETWAASVTAITVNVQANDSSGYILGQPSNFQDNEKYIMFASKNTAITVGKRIVIDSGDNAGTYDIERVKKWGTHYELYCSLV